MSNVRKMAARVGGTVYSAPVGACVHTHHTCVALHKNIKKHQKLQGTRSARYKVCKIYKATRPHAWVLKKKRKGLGPHTPHPVETHLHNKRQYIPAKQQINEKQWPPPGHYTYTHIADKNHYPSTLKNHHRPQSSCTRVDCTPPMP